MIDPFYEIQKEFKYDDLNIIDNLENIFHKIKLEFNYQDFYIIDDLAEILNTNYDFINLGSCIQYFDNYEEVLEKITKNSKYIFFSGTHLYDSDDSIFKKNTVVKQVNVMPQINFLYFFNRKNFFKIFFEKKYNLEFENKNLTDKVNYDNFNNHLNNISYSDFLFEKNNKI